ncbi:GxxExxY protein [Flavivirga jejuensis]|uniref:GxxExxY protein n=1 Tax=Flavivirga jejuensis TaxID=870487 RepID=A0ABT8WV04_9FLAO|nr:GxxExxY protein [Flavivirga jejuensis]MDO5976825.1 GxxExxY protein [Flavivirga jejuensis]
MDAGIEVHRALGFGLLESEYQECLLFEFKYLGLQVITQRCAKIH